MRLAALGDSLCSISADNWALTTEMASLKCQEESKSGSGWSSPTSHPLCQPLISQLTSFQVEVDGEVHGALLGHQATCFLVPTLFLIRCVILGEFSPSLSLSYFIGQTTGFGLEGNRNSCEHLVYAVNSVLS